MYKRPTYIYPVDSPSVHIKFFQNTVCFERGIFIENHRYLQRWNTYEKIFPMPVDCDD